VGDALSASTGAHTGQRPSHRARRALATLALALWAPLCAAHTVTDTLGRTVTFAAAPQRIVSLLPSVTEAVCALQACDRLVGVDRFSMEPAQVRQLPPLGGNYDPDIEAIVRLRPDVVLMTHAPAALARLQALGLKVLVLDATNRAGIAQVLQALDALLLQSRAPALLHDMETALQAEAKAARQHWSHATRPRVYMEVNTASYAAAPQSFMGELLEALGADNVVPTTLGPFPHLSPEWAVRSDPDLIIQTGGASLHELRARPGWASMRAVRLGAVCVLQRPDSDTVIRPGPRLPEAAAILARCLRRATPPLRETTR
jgi:iron complex transport system substrate-binding protein